MRGYTCPVDRDKFNKGAGMEVRVEAALGKVGFFTVEYWELVLVLMALLPDSCEGATYAQVLALTSIFILICYHGVYQPCLAILE